MHPSSNHHFICVWLPIPNKPISLFYAAFKLQKISLSITNIQEMTRMHQINPNLNPWAALEFASNHLSKCLDTLLSWLDLMDENGSTFWFPLSVVSQNYLLGGGGFPSTLADIVFLGVLASQSSVIQQYVRINQADGAKMPEYDETCSSPTQSDPLILFTSISKHKFSKLWSKRNL